MKSKSSSSKKTQVQGKKTKSAAGGGGGGGDCDGDLKDLKTLDAHHHQHYHNLSMGGQLPLQKLHRNRTAFTEEQLQALENGKRWKKIFTLEEV